MLAEVLHKIAGELQKEPSAYAPRPSLAGPDRCIRSLVYFASGVPREALTGRAITVFDDSTWHEELTADWIRKSAYKIHSQQMEVTTRVGKGHIDGIVTDLLGKDRLLEHKALNHFGFQRIENGQWPLDYFTQVSLYLEGLQKDNPDLNEATLLVKNKNTSAYLEIILSYDLESDTLRILEVIGSDGERKTPNFLFPEINKEAKAKFDLVKKHVLEETLPPRPFELGTDYPCNYCGWKKTCWENYADEFETLEKDAALDQEVATAAGHYMELTGHEARIRKEKDLMRGAILQKLKDTNATGGKAGEYVISTRIQKKEAHLVKASEFLVLNIRKPKNASSDIHPN